MKSPFLLLVAPYGPAPRSQPLPRGAALPPAAAAGGGGSAGVASGDAAGGLGVDSGGYIGYY